MAAEFKIPAIVEVVEEDPTCVWSELELQKRKPKIVKTITSRIDGGEAVIVENKTTKEVDRCQARVVDRTSQPPNCYYRQCWNDSAEASNLCAVHRFLQEKKITVPIWKPPAKDARVKKGPVPLRAKTRVRFQNYVLNESSLNKSLLTVLREIEVKAKALKAEMTAEIARLKTSISTLTDQLTTARAAQGSSTAEQRAERTRLETEINSLGDQLKRAVKEKTEFEKREESARTQLKKIREFAEILGPSPGLLKVAEAVNVGLGEAAEEGKEEIEAGESKRAAEEPLDLKPAPRPVRQNPFVLLGGDVERGKLISRWATTTLDDGRRWTLPELVNIYETELGKQMGLDEENDLSRTSAYTIGWKPPSNRRQYYEALSYLMANPEDYVEGKVLRLRPFDKEEQDRLLKQKTLVIRDFGDPDEKVLNSVQMADEAEVQIVYDKNRDALLNRGEPLKTKFAKIVQFENDTGIVSKDEALALSQKFARNAMPPFDLLSPADAEYVDGWNRLVRKAYKRPPSNLILGDRATWTDLFTALFSARRGTELAYGAYKEFYNSLL